MRAQRILEALLARGYFPKELPPPFNTRSFAQTVGTLLASGGLPASFSNKGTTAHRCSYNLGRPGNLRRQLTLVPPELFFQVAQIVAGQWVDLSARSGSSPYSITTPEHDPARRRAFAPRDVTRDLMIRRARVRAGRRYLVRADIGSFYSSVYTHSIPWAIHTKPFAKQKQNQGNNHYGNDLDRAIRNGQDRQTIGIPVGPDTSFLISEVLLAAVDRRIRASHPTIPGLRLIDDYEFAVDSLADGEALIASVQETLSYFQLALNSTKTRILDLPQPMETSWTHAIRAFRFGTESMDRHRDIVRFFDIVFESGRAHPDQQVVQFALRRLTNEAAITDHWDLLEGLIVQGLMSESGGAPFAWDVMRKYNAAGCRLSRDLLATSLSRQIERHAPMGHSSEVAWSLWVAIGSGVRLDRRATAAVCRMVDSVVALLALDAQSRGLLDNAGFSSDRWQPFMTTDALREEHWLLSYQANVNGWLASVGGGDHVAADPTFGQLKARGVSFYDSIPQAAAAAWTTGPSTPPRTASTGLYPSAPVVPPPGPRRRADYVPPWRCRGGR